MSKKEKTNNSSKRVKVSLIKDLSKLKAKPIDFEKYREDNCKRIEDSKKRYEREVLAEKDRIRQLWCPCCKSCEKEHVNISFRNGPVIMGGRNSSTHLAEYYVCQECGNMYVDLKKKEITPPEDNRLSFF